MALHVLLFSSFFYVQLFKLTRWKRFGHTFGITLNKNCVFIFNVYQVDDIAVNLTRLNCFCFCLQPNSFSVFLKFKWLHHTVSEWHEERKQNTCRTNEIFSSISKFIQEFVCARFSLLLSINSRSKHWQFELCVCACVCVSTNWYIRSNHMHLHYWNLPCNSSSVKPFFFTWSWKIKCNEIKWFDIKVCVANFITYLMSSPNQRRAQHLKFRRHSIVVVLLLMFVCRGMENKKQMWKIMKYFQHINHMDALRVRRGEVIIENGVERVV